MTSQYTEVSLSYTMAGELSSKGGTLGRKSQTLGTGFIEGAMERPMKPRKPKEGQVSREYEVWANWNNLTSRAKIIFAVKKYVRDMGGSNPEFELM